jgi:hypothetical protein
MACLFLKRTLSGDYVVKSNARTYFYQSNGSETGTISHTITFTLRVFRLFCAIQNRAAAIWKKALNSTSHLECQTLFGNFFAFVRKMSTMLSKRRIKAPGPLVTRPSVSSSLLRLKNPHVVLG